MPDNIVVTTVSSFIGLIVIVIFLYIIKAGKSPLLFGKNAIADKQIKTAYKCRKQGEIWTEDKCPPAKRLSEKVDRILSILAFILLALIFVAALVNTVTIATIICIGLIILIAAYSYKDPIGGTLLPIVLAALAAIFAA